MTGKVELGWVAPQDPFYGISEENIVPRITLSNWNRRAVLRQDKRGILYLFVEKIATTGGKKRQVRFHVSVHRLTGRERKDGYGGHFETLEEAIRHANGEDGSAFARKTRPADLDTPIASPGLVVVNKNGDIRGLTNKARATIQGEKFWRDQLQEVNRELRWDESGILRNAADGRTSEKTDRDANREMEIFYRRYPQFRSSLAELHTEAARGRVSQVKWMIFSGFLEEMRRERFQELQHILPVVRSKAGRPFERGREHEIDRARARGGQIS